jgi:hypothetical protein
MNSIIKSNGEYLSTTFSGPAATWKLMESESAGPASKAMQTLDTFTDGKGNYITKRRLEIFKWAESGDIWLPGSKSTQRKAA